MANSRKSPGARLALGQVAPDHDVDDAAVILKGNEHRASGSRRSPVAAAW